MNQKLIRSALVFFTLVVGLLAGCTAGPETEDSADPPAAARSK